MDSDRWERIQNMRRNRGVREMMGKCPACGKPKYKHYANEANECKKKLNSPYFGSVEPEKREKMDLTKQRRQEKLD